MEAYSLNQRQILAHATCKRHRRSTFMSLREYPASRETQAQEKNTGKRPGADVLCTMSMEPGGMMDEFCTSWLRT